MVGNKFDQFADNYSGIKASVEERFMTKATIELIKPLVKSKNVLNLGLGNGVTGRIIDDLCASQTILEGSQTIVNSFSFKNKRTKFVTTYFENFNSSEKFDLVLANHVLEHVDKPNTILNEHIANWIKPDGILFITVPNAKSIHRRIGKNMGLLETVYDFNSSDIKAGHQRVYDLEILRKEIEESKFKIIELGGYNLKLTSLAQMKDWSQELLEAIFEVSKTMNPEICANLWVKAKLK